MPGRLWDGSMTALGPMDANDAGQHLSQSAATRCLFPLSSVSQSSVCPDLVMGVTDPDGDSVTITVTGVTQDEPVNAKDDGNTSPDAVIQAGAALVRAERSGTGNGRVYEISFKADDGKGGSCTGKVKVGVPRSMQMGRPRSTTARSTSRPLRNPLDSVLLSFA